MQHILITMLGKGRFDKSKQAQYAQYEKTTYSWKDRELIATPLVVEAILQIKHYDQLFILGTDSSSWDMLYEKGLQNNLLDENEIADWETISKSINERSLHLYPHLIEATAATFARTMLLKAVYCKLIERGDNEDDLWAIFEEITQLPLPNEPTEISLDITYGLRFHPMILQLALSYFSTVKPNVKIGNVYYGAFDLKKDAHSSAPILDLRQLRMMSNWTSAAEAFQQFGDLRPIVRLLESKKGTQNVVDAANKWAMTLRMSDVKNLKSHSADLIREVSQLIHSQSRPDLQPLRLLANPILEFPKYITKCQSEWQMMLLIARRQYQFNDLLACTLALWEAVIHRIAVIQQLNSSDIDRYRELSRMAAKTTFDAGAFAQKAVNLSRFRNQLAHLEDKRSSVPSMKEIENWLIYFEKTLPQIQNI